jgi:hypothetical protein
VSRLASSPSTPARVIGTGGLRRRAVLVVVLVLLLALAAPLWMPAIGTSLAVQDEVRPADAIVATYAVMTNWGLPEVARLHGIGMAPLVVLSDFESDVLPENRLQPAMLRELARLGVPEAAMVPLPGETPTSESEEAEALRALFEARGWQSGIVVTRHYRGLRTRSTLRGTFRGRRVELMVRGVPAPGVDLGRWWTNRDGVNVIMNEWPRVLYYAARGRF